VRTVEQLLEEYRSEVCDDARRLLARALIGRARSDATALETLLYVLNEEGNSAVRRMIVRFLQATRPISAIRALAKEMFDPDPTTRAHAALGLADYNDAHLLAPSLAALLDALPDPATRSPAERAIRTVTGKSPDKITISERERVKLGEQAQTIWPDHFADLPPKP
jgi:hypothetical protein